MAQNSQGWLMTVKDDTRSRPRAFAGLLRPALLGALLLIALTAAPASAAITSRGAASVATYASESTTAIGVSAPAGAQPGDVLVASIGFGSSSAKSQPTLTAPAGWTLASRTNYGSVNALAVYTHV